MVQIEGMGQLRRSHYCGEVTEPCKEVTVGGFVQKIHNKGKLIFVDLRDYTGILQLTFLDNTPPEIMEKAEELRSEWVIMAKGEVVERSAPNDKIPTGRVEMVVKELRVVAKAQTPPFEIVDDTNTNEELRLKYRYLDLRRRRLQQNLIAKHKVMTIAREYFESQRFIELETPMLIRSTPEGARDYLVPSRIHRGKFYALPQSPQIYKQLCMIGGFDRYFQIARCFRDEDLRADRQPEFSQIDIEMAFVDEMDVRQCVEGFAAKVVKDLGKGEVSLPLPTLTYREAMERYGSDKPDTRYGLELEDISLWAADCGFQLFEECAKDNKGLTKSSVRAIVIKNSAGTLSRKGLDKLGEHAKGIGAKGLATIRWAEETPNCSFSKQLKEGALERLLSELNMVKGDVALIMADKDKLTLPVLGALRIQVAKQLDLIPKGVYNFLWITEFPFFEWNEETGSWDAMHHPFTMPMEADMANLEANPGAVRAKAYDLVLNGAELCSGSIRITDPELQQRMFRSLGLKDEEIAAKFGFLVDAYNYGAPPHGGVGIGLDRLVMQLFDLENIRDVTTFPKVQNASELMSAAPAGVDDESLSILGIKLGAVEE